MVDKKCKNCTQFLTNDCEGLVQFNSEAYQGMEQNKAREIDVSGCC